MTAKLIHLARMHENAIDTNVDESARLSFLSLHLSLQEALVLRLLAAGVSTREIADHLPINEPAVKEHIKSLLLKAKAKNRA
jgi:DNA-binding CsgD family transcriptional regulator